MTTDELIAQLTRSPTPSPSATGGQFAALLGLGVLSSLVLMLVVLRPRPDLAAALLLPMFWLKLMFSGLVAGAAFLGLWRLGQPGKPMGRVPLAIVLPIALIWALAASQWLPASADERLLQLGGTWWQCMLSIALLSLPILVLGFRAVSRFAPTDLHRTGAMAGAFAGAAAIFVYSLHCPEMEPAFVACWYVLGLLAPVGIGALLGPRFLRW